MKATPLFVIAIIFALIVIGCEKSPVATYMPILKVDSVMDVTDSSATIIAEATANASMSIVAKGLLCLSIGNMPIKTDDGSGNGKFVSKVTNLLPNTTYNVHAYATNGKDTAYSDYILTFTTLIRPTKVNIITPGSLGSILRANFELGTTNLIVTGNIDARDFKTIRDYMPALTILDLSGATVAAYNGADGTNFEANSFSYAANAIPEFAFCVSSGRSQLKSIIMPSSITSISNWAFEFCSQLSNAQIPNSVFSIGTYAFYDCYNLKETLTIPASVALISNFAFNNNGIMGFTVQADNPNFSSLDGVLFDKSQTTLIQYPCSKVGSYIIPSTVTSFYWGAFDGCIGLTKVTIPNSITSICNYAFHGCTGLKSIVIPNSVTELGPAAFENCTNLTSVTIPSSVTSLGLYVFENCTSLTSVTIPSSITSITAGAFNLCTGLTSITIPSSVTSIEDFAFQRCINLSSITIPSSVTYIGNGAFFNCIGLTSIYANSTIPIDLSKSLIVFGGVNITTCTLYVPKESLSLYQAADQWKDFTHIVEFTP